MTCDPNWLDVSLLLTCDGTNGSTSFPDSSLAANIVTPAGAAQVSTTNPKFGSGCALFNGGSGTHLSIPVSPGGPLDLSTGDFTVECWIRVDSNPFTHSMPILDCMGIQSSNIGWDIFWNPSTPYLQAQLASSSLANTHVVIPVDGSWHAIALVRSGNIFDLFIDGVPSAATITRAGSIGTQSVLNIGSETGFSDGWGGAVDEVRVTKGLARYTPGVTYVPAGPFGIGLCNATVPDVTGDTLAAATAAITGVGLVVGTMTYVANAAPAGTVFIQSPVGGTVVLIGSAVNLTISLGLNTVPNVVGDDLPTATAAITGAGFVVGVIGYIVSAAFPGTVVDQNPTAGSLGLPGAPVNFDISLAGIPPNILYDELIFGAYFGGQLNLVEFTYMPGRTPFEEGATNLIINRYKQEPTDTRQRGVDFTPFVVPGEILQSVVVSGIRAQRVPQAQTNPLVTPLVISNVIIDPVTNLKFAFTASGGQNGIEYTVQFTCKTNIQSQTLEEIFSINVMVEDMFP
jgi:hypothetical protein